MNRYTIPKMRSFSSIRSCRITTLTPCEVKRSLGGLNYSVALVHIGMIRYLVYVKSLGTLLKEEK
ncbi:hypothetical protein E2C01_088201 [Portunus trituberculatus]|uniref:Uncharacterized protein n=1 Tax=Portunus trituberculatus TaxID=210409 RepID=A0A5B7JLA3_PORTR|nr:hypothetical protein [Portunus trituberculatus]